MDVVAEQRLSVLYPDGESVPVCLRVGRPLPGSQGDFLCPVEADGLRIWQGPREFSGVGSFHALMIGLRFLHNMLSFEVQRGAILHWEDGQQHLTINDFFVLHKTS
jgi:hypothetical protein